MPSNYYRFEYINVPETNIENYKTTKIDHKENFFFFGTSNFDSMFWIHSIVFSHLHLQQDRHIAQERTKSEDDARKAPQVQGSHSYNKWSILY